MQYQEPLYGLASISISKLIHLKPNGVPYTSVLSATFRKDFRNETVVLPGLTHLGIHQHNIQFSTVSCRIPQLPIRWAAASQPAPYRDPHPQPHPQYLFPSLHGYGYGYASFFPILISDFHSVTASQFWNNDVASCNAFLGPSRLFLVLINLANKLPCSNPSIMIAHQPKRHQAHANILLWVSVPFPFTN